MLYFRSLPKYSFLFSQLINLFSRKRTDHKIDKIFPESLLFNFSRDAIYFLLKRIYNKKGSKVNLFLPEYFCHEISVFLNFNFVRINWYRLEEDFSPSIIENLNSIDVILIVDFFGIKNDIESIRNTINDQNKVIIYDHTHCLNSNVKLNDNEFVIQSLYKHFPIPNGATLKISKNQYNSISYDYKNINFKSSKIDNFIWILKTLLIKKFRIIRFNKNHTYSSVKFKNDSEPELIECSIITKNFFSSHSEHNLKCIYEFYDNLFLKIRKKIKLKKINSKFKNSHLYAIKFENKDDLNKVFNLLKKCNLPVQQWPDKTFIKILPHEFQIRIKPYIDNFLFLSSFYNSELENKESLLIEKINFLLKKI